MKPLSQTIVRWLPHLRRHAHAFTGSRERGDSYVMACLSVVVTEPDRLPTDGDVRLGLFRLFHTMWRMIDREYPLSDTDPAVDELALCQGLAELPPLSRQVLLLASMEGFSLAEVAEITEAPLDTVERLFDQARAQIRGHLKYLVPLDFYRQARPRRAVGRPGSRATAARSRTSQAASEKAHTEKRPHPLKRTGNRPGTWPS